MPSETDIGAIVRKMESDWKIGATQISDYVAFDLNKTLNKIDAYLNSKQINGETDSLGRKKPFFNIVVAAANVWYRATDIDRKNIKIKGTKAKDYLPAFIASVHLNNWMKRNDFGLFLNKWGRVLSQYGSAICKFVNKADGLHSSVVSWNRVICDAIDFDNNPQIELLELTESQLRDNDKYDPDMVDELINSKSTRETTSGIKKDNKSEYYRLYEVHGKFSRAVYKKSKGLEPTDKDEKIFVNQMHVVSYVESAKNKGAYHDFTLFSGLEDQSPYMITHLIEEDGRVLAKGAVESLFEAQHMINHTMKATKDQLDLASKIIFQTSDPAFVGQNVLSNIETGDVLIHTVNQPLNRVNDTAADTAALQSFSSQWKALSNEITGISESMLGNAAPSGTAWRQVEALLQQNQSLFKLMTQNKGLYAEKMVRERVLPSLKKEMDSSEEIVATLDEYDIERIDGIYIRAKSAQDIHKRIVDTILNGGAVTGEQQMAEMQTSQMQLKQALSEQGNQRFFIPSEIKDTTWKAVFKDLEWEVEADVTGEDVDENALTTLSTMLQTIARNPAILNDPNVKIIWNKILGITGAVSPIEMRPIASPIASPVQPQLSPPQATVGQ